MSDFPDRESEARFAEEHPEAYMGRREFLAKTAAMAGLAGLATVLPADTILSQAAKRQAVSSALPSPSNMPVDHFVVLMMENRSFDHYLSWFPDADGKAKELSYPKATGHGKMSPVKWSGDYQGCGHVDPDHSWAGGRVEYNDGKCDGWLRAHATDAFPAGDPYAISYYVENDLPFLPSIARAFTLYDRYFCSLLGPTFPNRYYQWAAQSGGQAHNNIPPQPEATGNKFETIFDRAQAHGLSVRYYFVDQPFGALFGARASNWLRPISDYFIDCQRGDLPNIAFVDPPFAGEGQGTSGDEHPHGDIRYGQTFMSEVVHAFLDSRQWRKGALFVNYDEWGGFFDHVRPPLVPDDRAHQLPVEGDPDDQGPPFFNATGFRVPGVTISPWARRGVVSHQNTTHESILKLIAYRFGLGYLNKRHRYASNIGTTLDWSSPNFDVPDLPTPVFPPGGACPPESPRSAKAESAEGEEPEIGSPEWNRYMEQVGFEPLHLPAKEIYPRASAKDPSFARKVDRARRR